ncbi:MAG: cupredoxin domain-containing protein [Patescibacteria group bacterium]
MRTQKMLIAVSCISLIFITSGCVKVSVTSSGSNLPLDASKASDSDQPVIPESNRVTDTIYDPATTSSVSIIDNSFDPPNIKISAGDTVIWTNQDTVLHSIKADRFSSGKLQKGDTFSYELPGRGTYTYTCGLHEDEVGQIIVE